MYYAPRRRRRSGSYETSTSLYLEVGTDADEACVYDEVEIKVVFTYRPGQPDTWDEPGYGPEVSDWSFSLPEDMDVPLPMAAQAALEKFVEYHMVNDPHGWVDRAICADE